MTYKGSKQKRRRAPKPDRLTSPDMSVIANRIHYALAPLDKAEDDADRVWGIDRLPKLVKPETAEKYGFSVGTLNEAMEAEDVDLVTQWAGVCIRGLGVMDAEATAAGHQPATGDFWEYELEAMDGKPAMRFAIMRDDYEWQTAKDKRPDLTFYTMREIANALRAYHEAPLVAAVKENFPGAEITKITPKPAPVPVPAMGDAFEFEF